MSTEQRIEKLIKAYKKNKRSDTHQNARNIEVLPYQIIFQNYKGSYVYNVTLAVINISKASDYQI